MFESISANYIPLFPRLVQLYFKGGKLFKGKNHSRLKILIGMILVFSITASLAQTRTVNFQGRTVKVFPYKLENEFESGSYYYSDDYKYVFNQFAVPYSPEPLQDGEYVICYAGQYYFNQRSRKSRKKNKIIIDSFVVAAVFNVKNSVKNGPVLFYDPYNHKKPIATGFYKNDLKDSVWETNNKEEKISIEFKEGIIDGKVVRYNFKYKVQSILVIKNGEEVKGNEQYTGGQTLYQGRSALISKYRIKNGEESSEYDEKDSTLLSSWDEIQYLKEKLADGEYVMYYKSYLKMDGRQSIKRMANKKEPSIAVNFFIRNGKLEGRFYEFEYGIQDTTTKNNRKAQTIANYKNGKLDGKNVTYRKGKIQSKTNWKDGKQNGEQFYYYSQYYNKGKLVHIYRFKDGKQDGKEEEYYKGKLLKMTTWKDGTLYGPFIDNKDKNCSKKGLHFRGGGDSILEIKYKNKSRQIYTNSPTPFAEMDTSDLEWYLMPVHPGYNNQRGFLLYTKIQQIGANGKHVSTQYQYKGNKQIPYVVLNARGDTIEKATRLSAPSKPFQSKIIGITYDKENNRKHINEYLYNWISFNSYDVRYWGNQVSWTSFYPDSIVKNYTLNRPVSNWNGWMTKRDSTVVIYKKNGKQKISEKFSIKNFGEFRDIDNLNPTGFSTINQFEKRHYSFIPNDTVHTAVTRFLFKQLTYTSNYKKCLKDSAYVSDAGEAYGINPLDLGTFEYHYLNQHVYITGKNGCILSLNDKPYTGKIIVNEVFSWKGLEYHYEGEIQSKPDGIYIIKYISQGLKNPRDKNRKPYQLRNFEFNYTNGLLDGEQRCTDTIGNPIYILNFKKGRSDGAQYFSSINAYSGYYAPSENIVCNYDSGFLNGKYIVNDSVGNILKATQYSKGKLDGSYLEYDRQSYKENGIKQLILKTNFKNGNLNGELIIFNDGQIIEIVNFENGNATGNYLKNGKQLIKAESSDSAHDFKSYYKLYPEIKAKLKNGAFKDTVFAYWPEGGVNYIAVMDTDYHHQYFLMNASNGPINFSKKMSLVLVKQKTDMYYRNRIKLSSNLEDVNHKENFNGYMPIDLDPLRDNSKGIFTFYYKNGVKSQQGKIINYNKYGKWKYWSENGILMKHTEYKDWQDSISKFPSNYLGKITTYYPSGKKLMEGYIVSQEHSYQCNQELEIAYENVLYTHYYNEQGKDIFNNGNCKVTEFHLNGTKRYNGQISNRQNSGLWKFYDPTGNLAALGEYVNGQKQGRWLRGDLGGVNYIDNACTINEALGLIKERQTKNIDIIETLYQNGVEVSSSHLVLEKF